MSQIVASITLCISQHAQEPRTGSPDDLTMPIKAPHRITASLVFSQDLRDELTFGEIGMMAL